MKPPINSIKHIVQHTQTTVASAAVASLQDVKGRAFQSSVNSADDVIQGAVIKAIYIELWLLGNSTSETSFVIMFEKSPGGQANPTFTEMSTLDSYSNKKNVLYTTQGLIGANTTNAVPIYRGWLKIPKGKQRFGLNDDFTINIAALGATGVDFCGVTIYKAYN